MILVVISKTVIYATDNFLNKRDRFTSFTILTSKTKQKSIFIHNPFIYHFNLHNRNHRYNLMHNHLLYNIL